VPLPKCEERRGIGRGDAVQYVLSATCAGSFKRRNCDAMCGSALRPAIERAMS